MLLTFYLLLHAVFFISQKKLVFFKNKYTTHSSLIVYCLLVKWKKKLEDLILIKKLIFHCFLEARHKRAYYMLSFSLLASTGILPLLQKNPLVLDMNIAVTRCLRFEFPIVVMKCFCQEQYLPHTLRQGIFVDKSLCTFQVQIWKNFFLKKIKSKENLLYNV